MNSSILNDTSQSTRESRLASEKRSTRNVIAICRWSLIREKNNLDEDSESINQQMNELLKNVRSFFTIVEAVKKFSRKKRIDAIRKRFEKKYCENDIFVFLDDAKCVNREIVEKITIMNDVFVSRFLKLRIAFLALQKNDQLAQRMRFHCVESQLMKCSFENKNENDSNAEMQSQSEDDATAQRICRDWRLDDDLLCFKNAWYVLAELMRRLLLKQNHDDFHASHFDVKRTLELLKRKYYWSAMSQDVKKYVNACFACHRIKTIKHKSFEQLQSIFMLKKSRLEWIMNFIIDLSFNVNREIAYDSILVLVDRYTKYARYVWARQNWIAVQLIDAMIKELFIKYEISEVIITDRENLFIAKYWSAFCYHLKLALRYNIAFHSQTDEQTKRQNQTLEQYLRNYVNYQQDDWANWLAFVEYAYNNSHHDSINMSSVQALYIELIKWKNTIQIATNAEVLAIKLRAKQAFFMRLQLKKNWIFVSAKQFKYYDAKHTSKIYAIEDKVYLCVKNIRSTRSSKKLDYKYYESYKINMFIKKQSYRLKLFVNMKKIYNVFHVFLLEFCKDLAEKKQTSLIYVNDEKQWKIEQILDSRKYREKLQYYIKWLNWNDINNEWLNAKNMNRANDLIAEYHEKYFEQMTNERIARKRRKTIR